MTNDIAEGWYTDSDGAIRWWDGAQWTEHVRDPADELEDTAVLPADRSDTSARRTESRPEPEPDHKRRMWLTATVVGLLAFFLGMAIGGGQHPGPGRDRRGDSILRCHGGGARPTRGRPGVA